MPVAIKEWAVTVRALAEGEQLLTLRKGGIREENKHFEIEHDRFFLYPTFDHQRNDLVRQSHVPELDRALEEGVWPERRAARRGARPGRRHPAARPRAHPRLGRGVGQLPDHRPAGDRRALAVLHLDARLRGEAAGLEAPPPAARDRPAHLPHPAAGDRQGAARVPRLPLLDRALPRASLRGHARCSPTTSSSAPPEEIEAIASDAVPVLGLGRTMRQSPAWPGSRVIPCPSPPATSRSTRRQAAAVLDDLERFRESVGELFEATPLRDRRGDARASARARHGPPLAAAGPPRGRAREPALLRRLVRRARDPRARPGRARAAGVGGARLARGAAAHPAARVLAPGARRQQPRPAAAVLARRTSAATCAGPGSCEGAAAWLVGPDAA